MDDHPDEPRPSEADYDAALRLGRKYLYDGHEPYGPAVTSIARLLAAYRREVLREVICDATKVLEGRGEKWPFGRPSATPLRGPCALCHAPLADGSDTLCEHHLAEAREEHGP